MATIDLNKINLRKDIVLNLSKQKGLENQKAQVILCMDISGSMRDMYNSGFVQDVIERIVPVAMQFDDNQELELYLFENNCIKHRNNVTLNNIYDFVRREIIGKYHFGGTEYAPTINMIKKDIIGETSGGVFSMFKKKEKKLKNPAYVIFITDGENQDKSAAESAIKDISNYGIFFQFVGIGKESFYFLRKLDDLSGRFIDNANFFQVNDLKTYSDHDLYSKLLAEFPQWLKLAKQKNLIE